MKIQTQARLLVAGIVVTPLLIFLTFTIYRAFFESEMEDAFPLPEYEDVSILLEDHISALDLETVTRFAAHAGRIGTAAIFRDDFLVLYSSIPDFSPGTFVDRERMLENLDREGEESIHIFFTRNLDENRIYMLISPDFTLRARLAPFVMPALIALIAIGMLTVFSIGMSIVIAGTITNSVQVLENATRRIADGELDLHIDVKGSNEITSLTNSLNKMRTALKEDELRRSRFIMGITHDLKTPLALIKGYAEAIEDGVDKDPAFAGSAVQVITGKADQLEGMINNLLSYVRMDSGEWRARLQPRRLLEFLHSFVKTKSTDVGLLDHTLLNDINLPDDLAIPMDENLLYRALENLIHNAVRYTPPGSLIRLSAELRGKTIELVVSDNGPGIDSEDIPHVFEMFYRGSSSRREEGIGLGLSVVKWVVDDHGWNISVSAEKDNGTRFVINIPLN
jgi:signal transduction histidine kinase